MFFPTTFARTMFGAACFASLLACGGGGSSSPTSPPQSASPAPPGSAPAPSAPPISATEPATPGSWLTLAPSSLSVTTYVGEEATFLVNGTSSKTFSQTFNLGIVDSKGIIAPNVVVGGSGYSYWVTMKTASQLAPGVHTTNLSVRICEDNPVICAKPFPGSPWQLPLRVEVKSQAEAAKRITWTAAPIVLTAYQNETVEFKIERIAAETGLGHLPFDVTDGGDIVYFHGVNSGGVDGVTMRTVPRAAGTYSTSVQVTVCHDHYRPCSRPLSGSPWTFPITLTVNPLRGSEPLPVLSKVGAWNGKYGNASNTSHVAGSFDPLKFKFRKTYPVSFPVPVSDNGLLFTLILSSARKNVIEAWSEVTGARVWHAELEGDYFARPAVENGKVYINARSFDSYGLRQLWVFDQATGTLLEKPSLHLYWNDDQTVVFNGKLYTSFGSILTKSAGPAWTDTWRSAPLPFLHSFSPAMAFDGSRFYTFLAGSLYAFDDATGQLAFQSKEYDGEPDQFRHVVLSGKQTAYVIDNKRRLVAFDLLKQARAWVVDEQFSSLAYANDVLYLTKGAVLQARSAQTGAVLWTSDSLVPKDSPVQVGQVLVTDNLAFITVSDTTVAVDLTTRQVVWSHPKSGEKMISSRGVLYITSALTMDAIHLQ